MPQTLKPDSKVKWKSHGGEAHGKVVKKQTSPTTIKGHTVAASPANQDITSRPSMMKPPYPFSFTPR